MATGFFHHIGTFLLFIAVILLVITDITAPVVHDLSIMKVVLNPNGGSGTGGTVDFGTFGYCLNDLSNGTYCTRSTVGYSPASVMMALDNTQFSKYAFDTTNSLTKVMVLHPVATGLAFLSFLLALGAGVLGSLFAALVAVLTFVVTAIVLVCDFVLFSIIKSNVNSDGSGSSAMYSEGIWTILVAGICSLLGAVIVFLTCCSSRLHRDRTAASKVDGGYNNAAPRRRRFW